MLIGVGFSCRIWYYVASYLYMYVTFSGIIASAWEERDLIYLLSISRNFVVSVWREFLDFSVVPIGQS